jgi:class 3 adenylate cyclase
MEDTKTEPTELEMKKELKKLRLQASLHKNLSAEMTRQKARAEEAHELAQIKTKELDKLLKKQKLESLLRKNLADEMGRQKEIAEEAKNRIESISNQLSKYLAPQIYKSIFSGEQQVDLTSKRKKLTVFFSDLVGFTSISDSLESEEITAMLNYYLTEMANIALEFGGTIDKYVGDAILIFFGDPESQGVQEDALRCTKMAIAMQNRMTALTDEWAQKFGLREPLQIRIGMNTGYCTVGNFGSEDRLDYTVIGGQVNLAARLESITKPGSILISFDTFSQVSDSIECIERETVTVKGIREEVRTFEIVLDGPKINDRICLETENLKCSVDIELLESGELDKLTSFIEDAKQKLQKDSANQKEK